MPLLLAYRCTHAKEYWVEWEVNFPSQIDKDNCSLPLTMVLGWDTGPCAC